MAKQPPKIEDIRLVWIGSVPYEVVYKSPILGKDDHKVLWGHIQQGEQRIEVDSLLPPEMKRIVLMHEIIHGLLTHAGLTDHLEEIPERLAYQLDNLFITNPDLLTLWMSG